jgi:hypothetical protein
VPVLPWQRPRALPRRILSFSVPSRPAIESESKKASDSSRLYIAVRSRTTRYGDARLPRESPEPSTMRARAPRRRAKPAATLAPAPVVPTPFACIARSFRSISAKKLSDGLFMRRTSVSIGGESTLAST